MSAARRGAVTPRRMYQQAPRGGGARAPAHHRDGYAAALFPPRRGRGVGGQASGIRTHDGPGAPPALPTSLPGTRGRRDAVAPVRPLLRKYLMTHGPSPHPVLGPHAVLTPTA